MHVEDSRILDLRFYRKQHICNHDIWNYRTESDSSKILQLRTEFHVTIPPGKLGLTFDGDHQPTIRKVWDYCPVQGFVQEGQWLKSIQIPGEAEPLLVLHFQCKRCL